VLLCIEKIASVHDSIVACEHFAINILADSQELLARRFAAVDGDRFEGVGFSRGAYSVPILDDVLAALECRRTTTYAGGDHSI